MSDLKALREIDGIWLRRMERAEEELRQAQARQRRAEQALKAAQEALADYTQRLPRLIEQLYADCIGHLVSREFLQEKIQAEAGLRAHVAELKAKVVDAEKELKAAIEAVQHAQRVLNKERVKLDALRDLIKDERKKIAVGEARKLAKVMDDLAGSKFVRAMRAAA